MQQQRDQARRETASGSAKATKRWGASEWWSSPGEEDGGGEEVPRLVHHEQVHKLGPPGSRRST